MRMHPPNLGTHRVSHRNPASNRALKSRQLLQPHACRLMLAIACGSILGCASPQNCQPMPGYPSYPSYPGYPAGYTLPSGTSVPTVGAPAVGTMTAQPPMMGQPIPGSVPAYPNMNPNQPIPPGYSTGIPAR